MGVSSCEAADVQQASDPQIADLPASNAGESILGKPLWIPGKKIILEVQRILVDHHHVRAYVPHHDGGVKPYRFTSISIVGIVSELTRRRPVGPDHFSFTTA